MTPASTLSRRQWLSVSLGATLGTAFASSAAGDQGASELAWSERSLLGLGTTLHLRAAHPERTQAEAALDAAVAAIRRVEASMSLFRSDSELVRLNRDGRLDAPSPELLAVLRAARDIAQRTEGRFDPTVQPLWQAWSNARQQGRLPTRKEIDAARALVDWRGVDIGAQRVSLRRPGMALTLNGIAQGYATDRARDALAAHGIAHAWIDAGEISTLGQSPRHQPWTLGIENPRDETAVLAALRSDGRAVATSADQRSSFTADFAHHHILDPRTGDSPPALSSVTVLAPRAMLADALTKPMFLAGPARIPALARQWQVGVLWVDKAGRWQATPDLPLVDLKAGTPAG